MTHQYNPTDGLRNVDTFPSNPATEADARNQVQTVLDQAMEAINEVETDMETNYATKAEIQGITLGQIPDNSITENKLHFPFETAGGTAIAITLTIPTLFDKYSKTFIVSNSNNGEKTTINSKSLYKPNTTMAPNLIAGKAYTVWYDLTNDCFFIKASAEGNAVAGHVLAGDTFSNDADVGLVGTLSLTGDAVSGNVLTGKNFYNNDPLTKITGTMPENGQLNFSLPINGTYSIPSGHTTGGNITQNIPIKSAQTYTPTTTSQTITSGQYLSGNQIIAGETNLIPSNILAGISIFGVQGIATIESLGGKKFVSGNMPFTTNGQVSVNGLSFTPSGLILRAYFKYTVHDVIWCPNVNSGISAGSKTYWWNETMSGGSLVTALSFFAGGFSLSFDSGLDINPTAYYLVWE